jgi:CheY-like chemotaxis protein
MRSNMNSTHGPFYSGRRIDPFSRRADGGGEANAVARQCPADLSGKRVLVVEDDALVAFALAASLSDGGCIVVGPVGTVAEAKRLIEEAQFDGVLLDVELGGEPVDEVAAILARKNMPFAFVTGSTREDLPAAFRDASILAKPFTEDDLLSTIGRLFN